METLIPGLDQLDFVLIENVKGFEDSDSRRILVRALKAKNLNVQEFLVNPSQVGIPNSRLRYYLVAKKAAFRFAEKKADEIWHKDEDIQKLFEGFIQVEKEKIADYLHNESDDDDSLLLDDKTLLQYSSAMDIVGGDSERSCCFTKNYARYIIGTGSVLHRGAAGVDRVYQRVKGLNDDEEKLKELRKLKLRYFSPEEIALLMGFPPEFSFPEGDKLSRLQKYRLLGNSLNVKIVSMLIKVCQ